MADSNGYQVRGHLGENQEYFPGEIFLYLPTHCKVPNFGCERNQTIK